MIIGDKLRVFEAFAGYGSQHLALKRLQRDFPTFDFEVVGISEIDAYALQAYRAMHGDVTNFGDIAKIDWGGKFLTLICLLIVFLVQTSATLGIKRGLLRVVALAVLSYGSAVEQ